MSLEHLQGDYAVEVLMSSVYVSIYLSRNNFSCRRLASDFFFFFLANTPWKEKIPQFSDFENFFITCWL